MPRTWPIFIAAIATIVSVVWFFFEMSFEPALAAITSFGTLLGLVVYKPAVEASKGFRAGNKLRWIRRQVGWTTSEITELINIRSESLYLRMESGAEDVPQDVVDRFCGVTGVSPDWLKHSDLFNELKRFAWRHVSILVTARIFDLPLRVPFPVKEPHIYDKSSVRESLKAILRSRPNTIYVAVDPQSCSSVFLITEKGSTYEVWDLYGLDFWEEGRWGGDYKYLPYMYAFYHVLTKLKSVRVEGLYLTQKQIRSLYLGEQYPRLIITEAIKKRFDKGFSDKSRYWPIDLVDIDYNNSPKKTYQVWYGDWFLSAQKGFAENRKQKEVGQLFER